MPKRPSRGAWNLRGRAPDEGTGPSQTKRLQSFQNIKAGLQQLAYQPQHLLRAVRKRLSGRALTKLQWKR